MPKPKTFDQKCQFWAAHAAAKQRENISFPAYCKRHGLALSTFSLWRRRLAARSAMSEPALQRKPQPTRLLPVTLAAAHGTDTGLSIVTTAGQRIAVAAHFDPTTLRRLLAVLDAQP